MRIPWGSGAGMLLGVAPESRLMVWAAAVLTCAILDPATKVGLISTLATVLLMAGLSRPPFRVLTRVFVLGLVMLGPVFFLAPWSLVEPSDETIAFLGPVLAPFRVFVRGVCIMVLTSQVVVVLTRSNFRDGLARLPFPSLVKAVMQQVLMQVDVQSEEIGRILLAMRARGAARGFRSRLRIAFGMPRVWLGRLLFRAERHAQAMEARGYGGQNIVFSSHPWGVRDGVLWFGAVAWLFCAFWLRWGMGL